MSSKNALAGAEEVRIARAAKPVSCILTNATNMQLKAGFDKIAANAATARKNVQQSL